MHKRKTGKVIAYNRIDRNGVIADYEGRRYLVVEQDIEPLTYGHVSSQYLIVGQLVRFSPNGSRAEKVEDFNT